MIRTIGQYLSRAKQMFNHRFFQANMGISLLFLTGSLALLYIFLWPGMRDQGFVPLHYNIHFGVDLFGPWWQLFTAPFISACIILINTLISIGIYKKEQVLSYFFTIVASISSVILFIATIFIVILNLSYYG